MNNSFRIISRSEFKMECEPALRQVFVNDDPYDEPFAPQVESRRILSEDVLFELHPPLLSAIIAAASIEGDEGFYVSIIDPLRADFPVHWYVPFDAMQNYRGLAFPSQNVVYSPTGSWGILISDEAHALMGGSTVFLERIRQSIPSLDNQVHRFLKMWHHYYEHNGADVAWLPGLLLQAYDHQSVKDLLRTHGFMKLL